MSLILVKESGGCEYFDYRSKIRFINSGFIGRVS